MLRRQQRSAFMQAEAAFNSCAPTLCFVAGQGILTPLRPSQRASNIRLASGWEMRLIEAEAILAQSQPFAGADVVLTDDRLGTVTGPVAGDDGDSVLEPGEVWVYQATRRCRSLSSRADASTIP